MPYYRTLRRATLPLAEAIYPAGYFVAEARDVEFAGVLDATPSETVQRFRNHPNIYSNNLAALKYRKTDDGRVYEYSSYAYRPEGRLGLWQTHFRIFPHRDGTAFFVHYEYNPFARPYAHYHNIGRKWDAETGIEVTRELFDLRTDVSPNGVIRE